MSKPESVGLVPQAMVGHNAVVVVMSCMYQKVREGSEFGHRYTYVTDGVASKFTRVKV
jgi:hypothetical protein